MLRRTSRYQKQAQKHHQTPLELQLGEREEPPKKRRTLLEDQYWPQSCRFYFQLQLSEWYLPFHLVMSGVWPLRGFLGSGMSYLTSNRTCAHCRLILLGPLLLLAPGTKADQVLIPWSILNNQVTSWTPPQRVFKANIMSSLSKWHQHTILQQFSNLTFCLHNLKDSNKFSKSFFLNVTRQLRQPDTPGRLLKRSRAQGITDRQQYRGKKH